MHKLNPFTAMVLLKKILIKVQNLKFLSLFVIFVTLSLPCERIFIKTHGIESRSVIGPQNTMFAGTFVHFSAWNFSRWGSKILSLENIYCTFFIAAAFFVLLLVICFVSSCIHVHIFSVLLVLILTDFLFSFFLYH